MNSLNYLSQEEKLEIMEILNGEIDEEVEIDLLEFINSEIFEEEKNLYSYFEKISVEDILLWLEEYEFKWNTSCNILNLVIESMQNLV